MQRVLKKHLTPLSKNGTVHTHKGKGASEQPLTANPTMGNYAKATPMAAPMAPSPFMGATDPDDNTGM